MIKFTFRGKMVLKWLGLVLLLIAALFLFFTQLLKYIAPFIMAFIIMVSIEGLVGFFEERLRLSRGISVAISLLLFVIIVGGLLTFTFYRLTVELWRLALEIPRIDFNPMIEYFQSLFAKWQDLLFSLPESLVTTIEQSLELDVSKLSKIASEVSSRLMGIVMAMIEFAKFLPDAVVFIVAMLISTYFMSRDRRQISEFLSEHIPSHWFEKIRSLRNDMLIALAGFMKAQLFLMAVTFLELLIGYQLIGVKYAFFFALVTAIVDVLPVLGTGTILIPTSILYFIMGNISRGLWFLSLYLVIFIVRQILEPKVLSQSLGLHPLITLMTMYTGLKFMGVAGMLLGPIIAIVIKAFYKAGLFPSLKA